MRLTRDFYRPSASVNAVMQELPEVPGSEVYRYENNGHPVAMAFGGKRSKPDFHFRFPSEERREEKIKEWAAGQKSHAKRNAEYRKERNSGHSLEVGDVLNCSWGYDQTNQNFYQVVEVPSKCFVITREIASEIVKGAGESYTHVRPVKDAFLTRHGKGNPKRYKAGPSNRIAVYSFASAHKTDWESTHYETGFGYGH